MLGDHCRQSGSNGVNQSIVCGEYRTRVTAGSGIARSTVEPTSVASETALGWKEPRVRQPCSVASVDDRVLTSEISSTVRADSI